MGATFSPDRLRVEHVEQIDSTNNELLRRDLLLPAGTGAEAVWLVAARQTGGRGRGQRAWFSTPDASLTASFGRDARLSSRAHQASLSLVAGVALAQALTDFGVRVGLKWPNDIYVGAAKAGGILCETRIRGAKTRLVIGCGLNLQTPDLGGINQPAAGLFAAGAVPDRQKLAQALGRALLSASDQWLAEGFVPFRERWTALDILRSKPIMIHYYEGAQPAIARGIDDDGALLVELPGRPALARVLAEEVSVRPLVPAAPG